MLSVLVTLVGLATAIYLERPRESPLAPASAPAMDDTRDIAAAPARATAIAVSDTRDPAAAAPVAGDAHDPLAAAAAVPPPPVEPRAAEPPVEPQAGSTTPSVPIAPPQTAMLEAPPPAPAPSLVAPAPAVEPTHGYWVEYGVFVGERYAKRLQQALARQGLDATLVPTRAPDGRPLVRVRSAPLPDYAQARAIARGAEDALKISTLVHRVAAPAAMLAAHQTAPAAARGYWVQFGAFPHRHQAARLQSELSRSGIEATVSAARGTSGKPLFYVRSVGFTDRESAVLAAHRGQEAAKVDFLIGHSAAARSASRAGEAAPSQPPSATRKAG